MGTSAELDLGDVDGVRALWALADFERDLVSLAELIERNVLELVCVEEEVLSCAFILDEAEAFLVLLYYNSFLHTADSLFLCLRYQVSSRR